MPKSTKKKKEKSADFKKAKLKLGKGKQVAANATDTSFKARSIGLPTQSIDRDARRPEHEPTTKRRLALDDLLSRLKHYSPGNRKDAILGLRELLGEHQELIDMTLSTLVNATVSVITDEDSGVRKNLIHLYEWLLPLASENSLAPHAPLILLHTTSALSHIFVEIRVDAVKFLDVLMGVVPLAFLPTSRKIIDGYLALLNLRGRAGEDKLPGPSSSTPTNLSLLSKLTILKSLTRFVRTSVVQASSREGMTSSSTPFQTPTWYLRSSLATPEAYLSIASTFHDLKQDQAPPPTYNRYAAGLGELDSIIFPSQTPALLQHSQGWKLNDLNAVVLASDDRPHHEDGADSQICTELVEVLQPLIISTFLDFAPSIFIAGSASSNRGNNAEEVIELLWCIGELTKMVYGAALQAPLSNKDGLDAKERLGLILTRMALYFPFGTTYPGGRDAKSEERLQEMDIMYCELTSLMDFSGKPQRQATQGRISGTSNVASPSKRGGQPFEYLPTGQITAVAEWVIQALNGELSSRINPLGRQLTVTSYCALLPTIWSLLNMVDSDGAKHPRAFEDKSSLQARISDAMLAHCQRLSAASQVKRYAIEFIGLVILLQGDPQYRGSFRLLEADVTAFTLSLPRLLWELNTSNYDCTRVVLLLLLRMIQRRILKQLTLQALSPQMAPFFMVNHATKGALAGPFTRLKQTSNVDLPKLALDVIINFLKWIPLEYHESLISAVDQAIGQRLNHEALVYFWKARHLV